MRCAQAYAEMSAAPMNPIFCCIGPPRQQQLDYMLSRAQLITEGKPAPNPRAYLSGDGVEMLWTDAEVEAAKQAATGLATYRESPPAISLKTAPATQGHDYAISSTPRRELW